jgi:hypothetical protein
MLAAQLNLKEQFSLRLAAALRLKKETNQNIPIKTCAIPPTAPEKRSFAV